MQPSEAGMKPAATVPVSPPQSAGWTHWLALVLLFGADIALRVHCLACKPFWFDEAFSVEVARIDWRNFLHLLWWREANMSLYYVLLRGWLHFGQSPFFVRTLSVAISAAAVPALYWLAKSLYDRRVALIAAGLLAFNVFDIRYAQEARSYSLFVVLATLSSGFFVAFLKDSSRRNRIAYVCFSVLAVYAHFYALLLISAQWLALRWLGIPGLVSDESRASIARQLRRTWITIGIAVLPLLIFVAKTGAGPIKWIPRPGLSALRDFATHFSNALPIVYFGACLLALLVLKKNALSRCRDWETWRVYFLFIWLLFPIVLTVLLSFARPVFLPRYMIFCIPALLILTAAGLASIRPQWLSAAIVGAVLLLSARYVPFIYGHDFDDERDASGAATDFILDHAGQDDGILFHIAETRVPYEFFRSLRAGENTASPTFTGQLGPEILFPHHAAGLDYRDFTGKPTTDFVRSTVASHPRMWLMLMSNVPAGKPDPTTQMLTLTLPETFPKMQQWEFARVEVRLYSK
jgi:mannosyltransferase